MCPETPTLQIVSSSNKLAQDKLQQAAARLLFLRLCLSAGGSRARRSRSPTLSEDRESHLASVCSLFKQRGVRGLDMRSHLSRQIDASLSGTLQSFSRGFPLRAKIGIMEQPKCLLLSFLCSEEDVPPSPSMEQKTFVPLHDCKLQSNVRRATILNHKGAKISLVQVMSSAFKGLTGLKEPFPHYETL